MVFLKRIDVWSAGRFGFWFGFVACLTQVSLFLLFLIVRGLPVLLLGVDFWMQVLLSCGVAGGISAVSFGFFATLYNAQPTFFGGLKLEFEMIDSPSEKAKNDDANVSDDDETPIV